jgi:hypothetical protein
VAGEFLDLAGKDADLDRGGAGILGMHGRILDNGCLCAFRKHWLHITTPCQFVQVCPSAFQGCKGTILYEVSASMKL